MGTEKIMEIGKIVVKGRVKLLSPMLIASGRSDNCDLEIIVDSEGDPFLPATSLVGALRHYIALEASNENQLKNFWGYSERQKGQQSRIIVHDLPLQKKSQVVIRDGIKIDNKTGTVEPEKKYDYQVLERGAEFALYFEVSLSDQESDRNFARKMTVTILRALRDESFRIGAKTNSGLGNLVLGDYEIYEFDFHSESDVVNWLCDKWVDPRQDLRVEPFALKSRHFSIQMAFDVKNSLIIRSYPADPESPDAVQLESAGVPVLSGTSIKGTIRARAEKIANTTGGFVAIRRMFGEVDEQDEQKAIKGKVRTEETLVSDCERELQARIKIDRFTGGVIESALFETMPLFARPAQYEQVKQLAICDHTPQKNICIAIRDYEDYEVGLLLLVLKDLATGDLPIGGEKGIGRGVLKGGEILLKWDCREAKIVPRQNGLDVSQEDREALEQFVSSWQAYAKENQ